jgi:hypothetical protein
MRRPKFFETVFRSHRITVTDLRLKNPRADATRSLRCQPHRPQPVGVWRLIFQVYGRAALPPPPPTPFHLHPRPLPNRQRGCALSAASLPAGGARDLQWLVRDGFTVGHTQMALVITTEFNLPRAFVWPTLFNEVLIANTCHSAWICSSKCEHYHPFGRRLWRRPPCFLACSSCTPYQSATKPPSRRSTKASARTEPYNTQRLRWWEETMWERLSTALLWALAYARCDDTALHEMGLTSPQDDRAHQIARPATREPRLDHHVQACRHRPELG